ncbi:hypothetical protein ACWIUD_02720 [Helicobacter sp. 23-1044]
MDFKARFQDSAIFAQDLYKFSSKILRIAESKLQFLGILFAYKSQ